MLNFAYIFFLNFFRGHFLPEFFWGDYRYNKSQPAIPHRIIMKMALKR